jgi:hypothetical protein
MLVLGCKQVYQGDFGLTNTELLAGQGLIRVEKALFPQIVQSLR